MDARQYEEAVLVNRRAVVTCRVLGNAEALALARSQLEKAERGR